MKRKAKDDLQNMGVDLNNRDAMIDFIINQNGEVTFSNTGTHVKIAHKERSNRGRTVQSVRTSLVDLWSSLMGSQHEEPVSFESTSEPYSDDES